MGVPLSQDVDFLTHYGVKGMRWGVRKDREGGVTRTRQGYANRKQRKANRMSARVAKRTNRVADYQTTLDRIATGKKTANDIVLMWNSTTLVDIGTAVANRESLGSAYARNRQPRVDRAINRINKKVGKIDDMRAHAERVRTGQTVGNDMLKFYGTFSLRDTIRG